MELGCLVHFVLLTKERPPIKSIRKDGLRSPSSSHKINAALSTRNQLSRLRDSIFILLKPLYCFKFELGKTAPGEPLNHPLTQDSCSTNDYVVVATVTHELSQ